MDDDAWPRLVPELDVEDLETSIAFYGLLGFQVTYGRPAEGFVYLSLGSAHLMLQTARGPGRRFRTAPLERPFGRGMNLQVEVDQVRTVYDAVVRAGHARLVELEERWYTVGDHEEGNLQFVVADPDGYLVRPFEDLASRTPQS